MPRTAWSLVIIFCSFHHQIPWCSTRTDSRGRHVRDNYGHCWCHEELGGLETNIIISYNASKCCRQSMYGVRPIPESGTYLPTKTDECSNPLTPFIFGGEDSKLQQFPFYALLGYEAKRG